MTGIALAAAGYGLFSVQDATVKWLVGTYSVPQILFTRSLVILAVAYGFGGRRSLGAVRASPNRVALVARAALILLAWLLYYTAARHLGLAQLTTLYFGAPVVAVVLSTPVLGERVGAARWSAVGLGFAGVVLAAGPTGRLEPGPTALALGAAACWGLSVVLARLIGRTDSTPTQMLVSNALFALACASALPWLWHTPDARGLGLMLLLGVAGGFGQYLLYEGFRFAPASVLAPIEYTGLVWAFAFGYLVWRDVPAWNVFAGAAVITASSLALVWFERRRARSGPASAARS